VNIAVPCPAHGSVSVPLTDIVMVRCPLLPHLTHLRFLCPSCGELRRSALTAHTAYALTAYGGKVETLDADSEAIDLARRSTVVLDEDEVLAWCVQLHALDGTPVELWPARASGTPTE